MLKKLLLGVLPLVFGLLWIGSTPGHATGESWKVIGISSFGCGPADWDLTVNFAGTSDGEYVVHTMVSSGGLLYMNEGVTYSHWEGDETWHLSPSTSYGPTTGIWPIPAGRPMTAVFTLEQPKGTVLSSWTMVAESCDSDTLLYNGPTAADLDEDYLATPDDLCPTLKAFRANGCPLHDRTLTLRAKHDPKRVVGRLYSAGHPALYAGRAVTIWKVRPGPDRKVATRTTDALGRFKARVRSGRYYATAPALLVPSAGQVTADRSTTTRVS